MPKRRIFVLFSALVFSISCFDYIYIKTSYLSVTTGTISIQYNISSINQTTALSCSPSNSNIKIDSLNVEVNTALEESLEVVIGSTTSAKYEVTCSVGDIKSNKFYVVYIAEPILYICQEVYRKSDSLNFTFNSNKNLAGVQYDCNFNCKENGFELNFKLNTNTNKTEYTIPVDIECQSKLCSCLLTCGNLLLVNIFIISDEINIYSNFAPLSSYQNASVSLHAVPPAEITCKVFSYSIKDYNLIDENDVSTIVLEKLSKGTSYQVNPKNSTKTDLVYGITCGDSASYVFQYVKSKNSTLLGPAVQLSSRGDVLCSCDATELFCDVGCCCDTDCSAKKEEAFECLDGLYGGFASASTYPKCDEDLTQATPWDRALCIKRHGSAFIGTYYPFKNESVSTYTPWISNGVPSQKEGYIITSRYINNVEIKGYLSLPGRIGSTCVVTSPVTFPNTRHDTCTFTQNNGVWDCSPTSTLNVRSFLTPTDPTVDLCKRGVTVYNKANAEIPVNVHYSDTTDNTNINDKIIDILSATRCLYAVTRVKYTVTVANGDLRFITANIGLTDLTTVTTSITASYSIEYVNITENREPEPKLNRGYELFEDIIGIAVPTYGLCNSTTTVKPLKFGVGTIAQCYIPVEDLNNCSKTYDNINATVMDYWSKVTSDPGGDTTIIPVEVTRLNISRAVNNSNILYCEYLPVAVHVNLYTVNNTLGGRSITNATFYFEHRGITRDTDNRVQVYFTVRFWDLDTILSNQQCTYCIEHLVAYFIQNQAVLFNSLLLVCIAAMYCFISPKNLFKSQL